MEAGSILGVSKLRTPLLDDILFGAGRTCRRCAARRRHRRKTCQGINPEKFGYHMDFFLQDEDDEVIDDEDFDDEESDDEDDAEGDEDEDDEEETWQVARCLDFVG